MNTNSLVEHYLFIPFFLKIEKLNWLNRARTLRGTCTCLLPLYVSVGYLSLIFIIETKKEKNNLMEKPDRFGDLL